VSTYFDNTKFKDLLVALTIQDRQFLRSCKHLLEAKDFKPRSSHKEENGHARYVVAQTALSYFAKYNDPVGDMLETEIISHCRNAGIPHSGKIVEFGNVLADKKIRAVSSIVDRLIEYKKQVTKANAVSRLVELQSSGQLSDDKWIDICRQGIAVFNKDQYATSDYFKGLQDRIDRRRFTPVDRYPVFFIDPLDERIRSISRGHIGLLMAPYKGGKSLGLIHIAVAHCIQRYKVLYFTLEDPKDDVEDRFDSQIAQVPIKHLAKRGRIIKERFQRFVSRVRGRIRIVDATEGGLTLPMVESVWEEQRNQGFTADVVIIDYDDELRSTTKRDERRYEFADIYRDMRVFAAKKQIILWTAAQTKRGTKGLQKIGGDDLAEDVSKVRKVSLAIGLGKGEWGDDSMYLWVAAHKLDKQYIGCNIMQDKERMMFYDREQTMECEKHPPQVASEIDDL
jgi:hypothetical protein